MTAQCPSHVYAEVLQVMKVLWEEISRHQVRISEAVLAERQLQLRYYLVGLHIHTTANATKTYW
jgi:hypothetical protein